ncbi:MAG: T9SS type A sorting domain-containing protein [Bacteroidota bacterium]
MKKSYFIGPLLALFLMGSQLYAQRVVLVEASEDPENPTDLFTAIMGDTTATGERTDVNTVYQLVNGGVYVVSDNIVNTPEWKLHIEAVDVTETDNKPILTRKPFESGTEFPNVMYPEGDVTLTNIWIISGEKLPGDNHDWGKIRLSGYGSRVEVTDCIIEKDRGGFLQVRADSIQLIVKNCIFRNGGNRRVFQGNGRGIDSRDRFFDSLVVKNSLVYNIQDRFFRSQGRADKAHHYVEIDGCTSFNTAGRHGHIQLKNVETAKITNNLFINPIMLGSSPVYTDEQNQPDADLHKVVTLDTLTSATQLTMLNNNIFWTQDVLDYWASNDSVNAPPVLSDLVKQTLGADTTAAFFSEVLELESIPGTILQYVVDLYNDPASTDMFDFIVEDASLVGTDFDTGNLFDFSTFSPCYGPTAQSATASTTGGPIGAVGDCPQLATSIKGQINTSLSFGIAPNPVFGNATFRYQLTRSGEVSLAIYDLSGRVVDMTFMGVQAAGEQEISWNPTSRISNGLYVAKLQTAEGIQTLKFIKN